MHTLVKKFCSNLGKASFALLLVACSSGSEAGSSGSAAQIASYDFCDQLAGAVCDGADLCCSKPQLSHTDCATEVAEGCSNDLLWNIKKEDYDPARGAAVVADVRKAGQACAFFTRPKTWSITKLLSPRVGEPCGAEYPYKDSVVCPEDAFCAYNATAKANICTKLGQQGDACNSDHTPCAKDFNCIADSGHDAQCVRRLKKGESCTAQYDGYEVCVDGLECIAVSTTAAECQPVRDKGGKCASYHDCASQLCAGADTQTLGACAACSIDDDCGSFGHCVKGACALSVPLKDGEACGADENCESGKCYDGQCGLPTADDAFCIAKGSVKFYMATCQPVMSTPRARTRRPGLGVHRLDSIGYSNLNAANNAVYLSDDENDLLARTSASGLVLITAVDTEKIEGAVLFLSLQNTAGLVTDVFPVTTFVVPGQP